MSLGPWHQGHTQDGELGGPWPCAGRRLRAAPRGTGWGPAAGRGRRSWGSGSLPLARAQESAEGRAEAPGWAAPRRAGGRTGGGRFLGPRVQGAAPSARPSVRRHCPNHRAAGHAGRGGVAGSSEWRSVGGGRERESRWSRRQRRAERPALLGRRHWGTGRGRGGSGRVGPDSRPAGGEGPRPWEAQGPQARSRAGGGWGRDSESWYGVCGGGAWQKGPDPPFPHYPSTTTTSQPQDAPLHLLPPRVSTALGAVAAAFGGSVSPGFGGARQLHGGDSGAAGLGWAG